MRSYLIPICLLMSSFLFAQGGYTIEEYNITMSINAEAKCLIEEDLNVRFNEKKRGIIRQIPMKGNFDNHSQSIDISDIEVLDWKYKVTQDSKYKKIRIGDPNVYLSGSQQYTIKYIASNGILNFEDHEEIYWTIIGPEWDANITNANFTIHLPKPIDLSTDDLQIFSGNVGENTGYGKIIQMNDTTLVGQSLTTLGNGKGLTIGVKFPKGYYFNHDEPISSQEQSSSQDGFTNNYALPLPILLFFGLIGSFIWWGRKKEEDYTIVPSYYPPVDMSPAEVGYFYDYKINNRDIIALIPKWGEEGIINVKVLNEDDIYLEKINDISSSAKPHEIFFFDQLFEQSSTVYIQDLKYKFYGHFSKVKTILKTDIDPGLYDEEAVSTFHGTKTIILGIVFVIIAIVCFFFLRQLFTGFAFLGLGIATFIIRSLEPKKSVRGIQTHQNLSNLYYTLIEPDEKELSAIIDKDPRYLEKIFPYVVAFGIEDKWAEQFEGLSVKGPDWYYYADGRTFGYTDFNRGFNTKTISKTMAVPPVADGGSSSFGGGGSVGGGFGGGGGSSW